MLIYLDRCCLKRPFDNQSNPRVRLECEAVLTLLSAESSSIQFVRSPALLAENSLNRQPERARRVELWLRESAISGLDPDLLTSRSNELVGLGLKVFDALHLATAEACNADRLATCDDRLMKVATRLVPASRVQVMSVVDVAREVLT